MESDGRAGARLSLGNQPETACAGPSMTAEKIAGIERGLPVDCERWPEEEMIGCGHRDDARWDSLTQAEYVAQDLSKREGGTWVTVTCSFRPPDRQHWHLIETRSPSSRSRSHA